MRRGRASPNAQGREHDPMLCSAAYLQISRAYSMSASRVAQACSRAERPDSVRRTVALQGNAAAPR